MTPRVPRRDCQVHVEHNKRNAVPLEVLPQLSKRRIHGALLLYLCRGTPSSRSRGSLLVGERHAARGQVLVEPRKRQAAVAGFKVGHALLLLARAERGRLCVSCENLIPIEKNEKLRRQLLFLYYPERG